MNLSQKGRRALAMALIALLTLAGLSAAAERVISTKRTRVYQSPSKSSASIAIPAGTVMQLSAAKDGWIRVKRAGITAYMKASDAVEFADCGAAARYLTEDAPLYKAYGKAASYGTIPKGARVTVYALAGDWACASYRGCRGFVAKSALTGEKPEKDGGSKVTITKGLKAYVASDGAKVYQSWSTSSKVLGKLRVNTRLAVGAVRGDWALVRRGGHYGFMRVADLSKEKVDEPKPPAKEEPAKPVIQAKDWWTSDIQTIFARGVTATVTDVDTGISWREVRKGGTNHADCQPLTAQDTANMKRACGKWSWERRAIVVTIDGQHYAASMNCMPHGGGSVTGNDYDGHHCIHFINSRTSGSNKVDPDHQAAIKRALALNSKL